MNGTIHIDNNRNITVVVPVDDCGNQVADENAVYRVCQLVGEPRGYLADACYSPDQYPGPCISWYGRGERYPDYISAIHAVTAAVDDHQ